MASESVNSGSVKVTEESEFLMRRVFVRIFTPTIEIV
jgi:hypothetical protein